MKTYRKRALSIICWRFFVNVLPVVYGINLAEYAVSMDVQTDRFICTKKDNLVWLSLMHPPLSKEKRPRTTNVC